MSNTAGHPNMYAHDSPGSYRFIFQDPAHAVFPPWNAYST